MKYTSANKQQGTLGELVVATELASKGYEIFFPFGDNSKTDLIAQCPNGKLHRIQVKTYSRQGDVTHVYFMKNSGKYSYAYTEDMFDWFAIVDSETNHIAWLPSTVLSNNKKNMYLRHVPPKQNKSRDSFHMFEDYVNVPF